MRKRNCINAVGLLGVNVRYKIRVQHKTQIRKVLRSELSHQDKISTRFVLHL